MKTTYKYIGGGTTILTLSALLIWIFINPNFKVEYDKNIACYGLCEFSKDSDCIAGFNITANKTYTIKIGTLLGNDKIFSYDIEKKENGIYKKVDISKGLTFKANKKNEFILRICKNNTQDTAFVNIGFINFTFLNFKDIDIEEECRQYEYREMIIKDFNITNKLCIDPFNLTCFSTIKTSQRQEEVNLNKTICERIGYNIRGNKIYYKKYGYNCNLDNNIIVCDSKFDGNGDGICKSGESCIFINITDLTMNAKIDSKKLGGIKIE